MVRLSPQSSVFSPPFGEGVAERYDGFRGLPGAAADLVCGRIVAATGLNLTARVLDLGAGTGRVARPFLEAGYSCTAIDTSLAMLARLSALPDAGDRADLALASGARLPFATGAFDLVLAVQVLGLIPDWPEAVRECRRVLRPRGWAVLGRVAHDPGSLQARVRRARIRILSDWGLETRRPGAEEDVAAEALAREIGPALALPPLTWRVVQRPREALAANLSGWRVQALPRALRERLHEQLAEAVGDEVGDLDTPHIERAAFSLRCFRRVGYS